MRIIKTINYDIIKNNLARLSLNTLLVLKDDAYGCDLKKVLAISYQMGFRFFCVLNAIDASYIVSKYSDSYALILGKEKTISITKRVFLTVEGESDFSFCKKYNMPFHYKIKSKMNRFGNKIDDNIVKNDLCMGIYAHIGYYDKNKIKQEIKAFSNQITNINHKLIHLGGSHLKGTLDNISLRVGMAIYDGAISLLGKIVKVFKLKANESLGYNDSYIAKKDILVGIVDVGYNSGLSSYLHHKVFIKNNYYKMIGIKCMDFSFIEIDGKIKVGDEVELLGPHLKIEELEKKENKSRYELYVNLK